VRGYFVEPLHRAESLVGTRQGDNGATWKREDVKEVRGNSIDGRKQSLRKLNIPLKPGRIRSIDQLSNHQLPIRDLFFSCSFRIDRSENRIMKFNLPAGKCGGTRLYSAGWCFR
jgi:hypothetical protein